MLKYLKLVEKYLLYAGILLFPVFVIFSFGDFYILPKLNLLLVILVPIIVIKLLKIIITGQINIWFGKYDAVILFIVLSYILSTFLLNINKLDSLLIPGTTSLIIFGAIFYFFVNQLSERGKKDVSIIVVISSVLLAIIEVLALVGLFGKIPQLPQAVKDSNFNPFGSDLASLILMLASFPIAVSLAKEQLKPGKKALYFALVAGITLGAGIFLYKILPGKNTSLLLPDINTSKDVAFESLKQSPILGIGSGNYLTAFNRFHSIGYNTTPLWNLRFSNASNWYLTLITETGLVGLAAVFLLILTIYKDIKRQNRRIILKNIPLLSVLIMLILFLIFPAVSGIIFYLFIFLALASSIRPFSLDLSNGQKYFSLATRLPSIVLTLPFFGGILFILILVNPLLRAEAKFKASIDAINNNKGQVAVENIQSAINLDPYIDRYHQTYSQYNLLAISNIIAQANKDAKKLDETQKNNVIALADQAIREAQAGAAVNIFRSSNWEFLANTYRTLIPVMKDADKLAIESYNQAITLDPYNPNLRIILGGIYYAQGKFPEAIEVFKSAVNVKPDLANAHYNLAITYRDNKQTDLAIAELQNVLKIVPENSKDAEAVKTEIENLQKKTNSKDNPETSDNLEAPAKATPVVSPKLEVPVESPSPNPTALPSPTPGQ